MNNQEELIIKELVQALELWIRPEAKPRHLLEHEWKSMQKYQAAIAAIAKAKNLVNE